MPNRESTKGKRCGKEVNGHVCESSLPRGFRRCVPHGIKEAQWQSERINNIVPTNEVTIEVPEHFGVAGAAIAKHGDDAHVEDFLTIAFWFVREHPGLFG